MNKQYDVVVVGAGAAGLMCAAVAGVRGRRVLLLDHAKKVGEKIRISGGGRCNFTNIDANESHYISENPRFCISALRGYTPEDFIALVERYDIAYHEKTLGQLFCDDSSQQIIEMLQQECEGASVYVTLETAVSKVVKEDSGFCLELSNKNVVHCQSLVVATGGLSIPKMGASPWGYRVAEQFGIATIPMRAGLVPFTLTDQSFDALKALSGVSLEVEVCCENASFREAMLLTHRGLSGPAILQISSYWREGKAVTINLLPTIDAYEQLVQMRTQRGSIDIAIILSTFLPKRFAHYFCDAYGYSGRVGEYSNKRLQELASLLHNWSILPNGTEGYRTAEVTLGGVDTCELSSKTLEAKKVPGLYFIGEVVDVTGHLGGFNFQWAWSSAYAAGISV